MVAQGGVSWHDLASIKMEQMAFQLAQINIGRLVAPIDDPRLADFVAQLDPVNGWRKRPLASSGASNRIPVTPRTWHTVTIRW